MRKKNLAFKEAGMPQLKVEGRADSTYKASCRRGGGVGAFPKGAGPNLPTCSFLNGGFSVSSVAEIHGWTV